MAKAASAPAIELAEITNFSGGPNFRDSPTELKAVEAYDAFNATFDERGGVQSRLGYVKRNAVTLGAGYKAQMLASSPKLYWRLDEGVGAVTASDVSGNGNDGTYSGVTLGVAGLLVGDSDTAGRWNGSPANNSVQSKTYLPFVAGSSRTFMGLANRTSTVPFDVLFGAVASGAGGGSLGINSGSEDVLFSPDNTNTVTWTAAWPGINQRVHWALTYNDATRTAELFINGVSKGALVVATAYNAGTQASKFNAGLKATTGVSILSFAGVLDEVAVFESILSAAAITGIYNASLASTDLVVNDYYSPLLGITLTQVAGKLYRADNTALVKAFTTPACLTFAEINGLVIACHPVDGLWSSPDGTTWTKIVAANAPTTGTNCVAVYQARLFVGLTDGTVHWSNLGTVATWTATDFNPIWEVDQQPVVALHLGSGQDIQGRPGLLVFKQDSVYRINNAVTGAFTVITTSGGAAGPKAVVGVGSRVCWIGKRGLFWWREDRAGPVEASDLLRPLWRREQLSFANQAGWAAGRRHDRAYFSCSTLGSNVNNLAIELHPDEGWVAPRSDAMTCYSTSAGADEATYGGSPTAPGQVYQLDTGGTDDGQNITGWFQTRWLIPNGGFQAQVWQARLHGRGGGTMTMRRDYQNSGGSAFSFDFTALSGAFLYDNGVLYDSGAAYAIVTLAQSLAQAGLGACRQFSLRFDFTVNSVVAGRTLPGNAPAPSLGAFALYGVECMFVPLGLS